jgi:hypothetical protein
MKKRAILCLSFLFLAGCAHFESSINNKESLRFNKKIKAIQLEIRSGKISKEELDHVYFVLKNTRDNFVHKMNGELDNQIYINRALGYKVIKDKNGNILKNHPNMGTYDFYDSENEPLLHFKMDADSWIKYGRYKEDYSTKTQRLEAYIKDLQDGVNRFIELKKSGKKLMIDGYNENQSWTLAFFIAAEREAQSKLFKKTSELKKDEVSQEIKKLCEQLKKIYQ